MKRSFELLAVPGFLCGLALASCGPSQAASPAAAAPAPDSATFLNSDGTVDYALLNQTFGNANENLTLNPRATDVAQTTSVNAVQNLTDRLIFPAASAGWLAQKKAGDTLYCGHLCGGLGFLRNIVSIETQGTQVVVMTVDGGLTDVLWNGWLHGEEAFDGVPFIPQGVEPGVAPNPTNGDEPAPRTEGKGPASGGQEGKHPFEGNLTGSFNATPKFTGTITIDMVVQLWSWTGPTVKLVKFDVTATPSITISAEVKAEAAATQSWEFWPEIKIPIAVIPLGPVEVTPELDLTLEGKLQALGSLTLTSSATLSETMEYGFVYTEAAGGSIINPGPKNNNTGTMSLKGEAGFTALAEFEASLPFKIYSLAGPQLVADLDLGAEGLVSAKTDTLADGGKNCGNELEGDFFVDIAGKVGVVLDVKLFHFTDNFQLAEKKWTFPTKKWTYEIPDSFSVCPTGGENGGSTGGEGSTGGSTGGGSSSGGNTGGGTSGGSCNANGNINCNSNSDCDGQSDCGSCAICIIGANLCGIPGNGNFCSTNYDDALGLSCSSTSDCQRGVPCANSGLTCAGCSSLMSSCSGNCCQFTGS